MTDTRNNGGPAFPHSVKNWNDHIARAEDGMSLRDWIAGQVVAAAVTNANGLGFMSADERREQFTGIARISYEIADAMLATRSSSKEA